MPVLSSRQTSAKLASLDAFDLAENVQNDPMLILDALPFLLNRLRASNIPTSKAGPMFTSQADMPDSARVAAAAMLTLCVGMEEYTFKKRPSCSRLLEASLPGILQWMQWFNDAFLDLSKSTVAEVVVLRVLHQQQVGKILLKMAQWVIPRDRILTSPGLVLFLWRMWLDEPKLTKKNTSFGNRTRELGLVDDDFSLINGKDEPSISKVVRCIVDRLQDPFWDVSAHRDALVALKASPTEVARIACSQAAMAAFGGATINTANLYDALTVLMILCTCPGYRESCRAQGSLSTVMAIAEHLVRNSDQVPQDSLELILSRAMTYMQYTLRERYHAMLEFLQDGGLILIFNATSIMGLQPKHKNGERLPEHTAHYLETFSHMLRFMTPFLPYLSISRHATRTLHHVRTTGLERSLMSKIPDENMFIVQWKEFCKRLLDIEILRSSERMSLPRYPSCTNPNHDMTENHQGKSKRCSGCSLKFYCSEDCQRQAWKLHKAECLEFRTKREAGKFSFLPIPSRDSLYCARFYLKYSEKNLAAKIAQVHLEANPSATGKPHIVIVKAGYTEAPDSIFAVEMSGIMSTQVAAARVGMATWLTAIMLVLPCSDDLSPKMHVGCLDLRSYGVGNPEV